MVDASGKEITHHTTATSGTFKKRLTEVFINNLPVSAAVHIQSAGIYEIPDSGCDTFDTLLVVLKEAVRQNPQAVIQAIIEMQWIHDKDKTISDIGMLQFSRLS